jgi:hypothetical protein
VVVIGDWGCILVLLEVLIWISVSDVCGAWHIMLYACRRNVCYRMQSDPFDIQLQ